MIKFIFIDAGGVLYLNSAGNAVLNKSLLDLLKKYSGRCSYGVISTTEYDLKKILKDDGLQDMFTVVVTSGDTGFDKANSKIYQTALDLAEVQPSEAIMIDNDLDFLEAAKRAGLNGILYINVEELRDQLASFL